MNPELQIKAIAELDGWTNVRYRDFVAWDEDNILPHGFVGLKDSQFESLLPPYLTSRDAIVPVIEKQDITILDEIVEWLIVLLKVDNKSCTTRIGVIIKATPSQLCEALLRATGKWIE